jgi:hypothetical protein
VNERLVARIEVAIERKASETLSKNFVILISDICTGTSVSF